MRIQVSGYLFVLGFVVGCVLAVRRHPIWGTATYVAVLFLSPQMRWWGEGWIGQQRWSYYSAIITALALVLGKKYKRPAVSLTRHGAFWLLVLATLWLGLQSFWALDAAEHSELLSYYVKFVISMALIYYSVDSEDSLRVLMWTYVSGCFYFGIIAFTTYTGGRFEGFGGSGINEANAGALTMVTGIFMAGSLFLAGNWRSKTIAFVMIPFIVDGLITTISRSGFLALAVGGLIYNWFTPGKLGKQVRVLSVLAVTMFVMLTGPSYWSRMQSLQHVGEDVQGMDTGEDRIAVVKAQWRMFKDHPLGCGATCTAVLSAQYIDTRFLAASEGNGIERRRASHNTYMTMLVEHGLPGFVLFLAMALWVYAGLRRVKRALKNDTSFLAMAFPAIAAVLTGQWVADLFVSYDKFELRIWFVALLMAMIKLVDQRKLAVETKPAPGAASAAVPRALPGALRAAAPREPGDSEMRSGSP
jgi:putative inorganic carbon (HCO3(-)) transporter